MKPLKVWHRQTGAAKSHWCCTTMSSILHQGILKPHRLIMDLDLSCSCLAHSGMDSVNECTDVLAHTAGGRRRGSSGCRGHWKSRRPTGFSRAARRLNSKKRKKSPSLLMTSTALYATSPSRARRPLPTMRGLRPTTPPLPHPPIPAYHHHTCPFPPDAQI